MRLSSPRFADAVPVRFSGLPRWATTGRGMCQRRLHSCQPAVLIPKCHGATDD